MLEVKVTNYSERYGIEVKNQLDQNDVTQPWIVIGRSMNKYVTELPAENQKPIHFDETALGLVKPVPTKQQEQFMPSSSSSSATIQQAFERMMKELAALAPSYGGCSTRVKALGMDWRIYLVLPLFFCRRGFFRVHREFYQRVIPHVIKQKKKNEQKRQWAFRKKRKT